MELVESKKKIKGRANGVIRKREIVLHSILLSVFAFVVFFALLNLTGIANASAGLEVDTDSSPINRSLQNPITSYSEVLDQVTPSVVSVHTAKVVRVLKRGGPFTPEQEFFRRFFGIPGPKLDPHKKEPEVEERKRPQGIGSGVIISNDGYILTNDHVVSDRRGEDADEIQISLKDGREFDAKIVGRDPKTDVAILKVNAEDLPKITIADSDNIKVGDVVFAIGNPLGVGLTVTQGIVSATGRSIGIYGQQGYENFIQTDASINPGNSGGALIDAEGRLIGINSAIVSRTGGNIGLGFAIPSNLALSVTDHLVDFGEVHRGYLGVRISDLSPDMANAFALETTDGVLVNQVEKESPAADARLERGDVIVSVDGKSVKTANQLRIKVGQLRPGSKVEIGYLRDGKRKTASVTIGDQEDYRMGDANELFDGVWVSELNDENRRDYQVPDKIDGLIITRVDPSSNLFSYFRPGAVIVEINDVETTTIRSAKSAKHERGTDKLYVYEKGRFMFMAVKAK